MIIAAAVHSMRARILRLPLDLMITSTQLRS
jgi:hypothetical protein